jgi:hypothetical protein
MSEKLQALLALFRKTKQEGLYVNVTVVGQVMGQPWVDYFKTERAPKILDAIARQLKVPVGDLVVEKDGCTWVHGRVAHAMAWQYAPEFAILASDQLLQELRHGPVREHHEAFIAVIFGEEVAAQFCGTTPPGTKGNPDTYDD